MIRGEFLQVMAHREHNKSFTQNDYSLITAGTWGELKLYDGKEWRPPCSDVASGTCRLLSRQLELVGTFPHARTHNVNLPKEAGYFQLLPGSRLKPHTGPVNFRLYCHLGLLVPEGPQLRVGAGVPRAAPTLDRGSHTLLRRLLRPRGLARWVRSSLRAHGDVLASRPRIS